MKHCDWASPSRPKLLCSAAMNSQGYAFIAASIVVLTSGCLSSNSAKDKHATFHHCKAKEVTLQKLPSSGHAKYRTTGCGHEETFSCIAAKCRSARILVVRQHAAEHKCKPEDVSAQESADGKVSVSGCGAEASYVCREIGDDVLDCKRQ